MLYSSKYVLFITLQYRTKPVEYELAAIVKAASFIINKRIKGSHLQRAARNKAPTEECRHTDPYTRELPNSSNVLIDHK
jgi:hypothetical protein